MPPTPTQAEPPLLEVRELRTQFLTSEGVVKAVDGVDFALHRGRTLCIVGESGCGKSVTARSILQVVDSPGRVVSGSVVLRDSGGKPVDLARLGPRSRGMRAIRGRDIAMIFQEPMSSLSPVHTIGNQIMEAVRIHTRVGKGEARARAVEALQRVGIARPETAVDRYTFELSGGMRQRAMIAMALVCRPRILIADEPTTALDVTTQAQILDLIGSLQQEMDMSLILITHDLGVVAEMADDVAVMYLGRVVEHGTVRQVFHEARHPYTQALLKAVPRLGGAGRQRLYSIKGTVPSPYRRPAGCSYHTRCESYMAGVCDRRDPGPVQTPPGQVVRCLLYAEDDFPPHPDPPPRGGRE